MKKDLEKLMLETTIPIYQAKTNQWILIHETQETLIKEKFYNNDNDQQDVLNGLMKQMDDDQKIGELLVKRRIEL